ncbi:MAG TPA: peroxiredoxin-like family protein [Enhygromyxa sp.]|nr:peroxiredoxin-like family protein [Enhygromyxa sp.]
MARVQHTSDLVFDLAEITLPDAHGNELRLRDLWADRTVVLVHLRHFGCILCRHYAAGLRAAHAEFEALGAQLVAIGTGGRAYAAGFIDDHQIPYRVLVDKHLTTHEIIGAKRGPPYGIFKPKVVAAAIRAALDGEMQGKTGPHPFVFGAAHVIAAGGLLRYAWINDDYQDNAPVEELLDAAREAKRFAGGAIGFGGAKLARAL